MSVESDALAAIDAASTNRVGDRTSPSDGVIADDPSTLASDSGYDIDTYSLARMVASEYYSGSSAELLALAEAGRNWAARKGISITTLLIRSRQSEVDGLYSEQAKGKWASTRLDPNGRHIEAANQALLNNTNLASGAIDYFDPSSQDSGHQGSVTLRQTSEGYIAKNAAQGWTWIGPVDGIDAYHLMLFSASGGNNTADAMAEVQRGRNGGSEPEQDQSGQSTISPVPLLIGAIIIIGLVVARS